MSRFFQGATRGHEGVRARDSCRFGAAPPVRIRCTRGRFILTITGIIVSLNRLDLEGAKPLDGERFGVLELVNRGSWYVVVSGGATSAEDRADGGHRGGVPIRRR